MGNCMCAPATGAKKKPRGRKRRGGRKGRKGERPNVYKDDGYYLQGSSKVLVFKGVKEGEEIQTKYTLGRELGRGEFGITYLCRDRDTQELLACKSISKKKLRTAVDVEDVRREVAVMHHLPAHPNIVNLKGVHQDDSAVHLVMELCEGGELFDRIIDRGHYSEREAASVTRTIVDVVQVCHKHRVMHRDLKPENFLFASKKNDSPLKAIDFGLSCFFTPGEKFSEIVGSPYYMAPEVLKRNYGPEVDVWSAGVILYILLCGVPPFWAETEQGVALAILRGVVDFSRDPWPKVSDAAKNLVVRMLEPDPRLRVSAQQVLEHPWLQSGPKVSNAQLGDAVRSRLKQFSAMNKLKKKALRIIAEHLSGEEIEGLREMFQMMDSDNSGAITFEELKAGLQKIGSQLPEAEVRLLMDAADVDGNGSLDYGEFVTASIHLQKMDKEEHLQKAFSHFDRNGSGYIDMDELRLALADDVGPNDQDFALDIMKEVDLDKDGQISYEEFASMMRTGTDWRKASRRYSRELFNSLSTKLFARDGSLTHNPRPTYSLRERR